MVVTSADRTGRVDARCVLSVLGVPGSRTLQRNAYAGPLPGEPPDLESGDPWAPCTKGLKGSGTELMRKEKMEIHG